MNNLLEIRDLRVNFMMESGPARAVDGINLSIAPGRTLGVVGESGCGKSVTSRAILGTRFRSGLDRDRRDRIQQS